MPLLAGAVQTQSAGPVTLRIIVVPTADEATRIARQLLDGADFAMLAAEWSSEPTARDGGFLGTVDPSTLRPELRDALNGVAIGQTTSVVRIPSGFAILKVVPASESASRSNAGPVAMLSTNKAGLVYAGLNVGGMSEADAVLLATPKPQGWDQDLQALCAYRKSSLATVIDRLSALPGVQTGVGVDPATLSHDEQLDAMEVQYSWGQLHAYLGELDKATERWQTARGLAAAGPCPMRCRAWTKRSASGCCTKPRTTTTSTTRRAIGVSFRRCRRRRTVRPRRRGARSHISSSISRRSLTISRFAGCSTSPT